MQAKCRAEYEERGSEVTQALKDRVLSVGPHSRELREHTILKPGF